MPIELHSKAAARTAQEWQVGGHTGVSDMSVAEGGEDVGPSPHDLYDAALGACKALTLKWYANRKGIALEDVHTTVVRDSSQERQGVYRLSVHITVQGDLTDAQVAELHAVAEKCPVHKLMTSVTTEIATTLGR